MSTQPNILLIMPDQMRGDRLSLANHPVLNTPIIDRSVRRILKAKFELGLFDAPLSMRSRPMRWCVALSTGHWRWKRPANRWCC